MTISKWQEAQSDGSTMRMYVSTPQDGAGPFPALVVMQHQGGIDEFVQRTTERLAQSGFIAAAPDLYHRDGPDCKDDIVARRSRLSDRRIINDIGAVVAFLQNRSGCDANRLGIIGFCMGGRLAFLGAATHPSFKASIAYYPGNLFRAWGRDLPSPFERSRDVACPIQGHFGADDTNPSPNDMGKLDEELSRLSKPHDFYSYENAGHAFLDFTKDSYRKHADESSWPRTLNFLFRHLNDGS
jgi:carboxymethylenebutenolidase